ncbi:MULTISPECIES: SURF1 family cytochrome oxidase biogenesis protein [unclassified Nocardiopsis]|uniref:SURF1 family cytochrome oxidase biogenesis protein n=1 Tax=Nocardiopsis TaxID=2013 RepID=UPI00387AA67C
MRRVLFSQRMLAFHALVLVIVPSFIWLGFWQLDRWEQRSASVELQQGNLAADPVSVAELTEVGGDVDPGDRWRSVTASGTWDAEHEILLRNRDGSGGVGFHVLTPLVTEEGPALLVNRGWIPRGETALDTPDAPPVPAGTVEVVGRLHFSETEQNTGLRNRDDLPEGQLLVADVPMIAEGLPYPVYGGYIDLTGQDPVPDPAPERLEVRELDSGMSLSYAVQWWVFTVVAIGGWVFLVRRELSEAREAEAAGAAGDTGTAGGRDGVDGPGDADDADDAPVAAAAGERPREDVG